MKRFEIITESDARVLDIGSTVELAPGGLVTPLARDTLSARRVTVVATGATDPDLPADLVPVADVRRVVIGSDHSGVALKTRARAALARTRIGGHDVGTDGTDPVDYPDIAAAVGQAVTRKEADAGSSSTARASARQSPPTRSAASAPRCASTKPPRGIRESTTAPTSSLWVRPWWGARRLPFGLSIGGSQRPCARRVTSGAC